MLNAEVTSLSSKGQVVIPSNIRKALKLSSGSKLMVMTDGSSLLLKPLETPKLEVFKTLIDESRKFAKKAKIKKADLDKTIKKVRRERHH